MTYRILSRAPFTFRLFRRLMGWDIPGAWRLYRAVAEGRLKTAALPFSLADGSVIHIPATWPGMITGRGLEGYEPGAIRYFAAALRDADKPVILIDCGADIGVFTRLVLAQAPSISRVVAFEPNPEPFAMLRHNCAGLKIPADLRCAAVSSHPGKAALVLDPGQEHDHGAFIGAFTGAGGGAQVDVETIDQLDLPPDFVIALKIDVEGEEFKVLQGAQNTLRRCAGFAVQFEAHPEVMARTGVDPIGCLALLRDHGAQRWAAFCERTGETVGDLSPDRPFFDQVRRDEIYDVIAVAERDGRARG